ncbi:MAG TPA: tRNA dihydrouridine(20/20a) synthase DusA [Gammaproteobacteria bacterium]|nr:tRNA dihydrouridine(20/20a) synthase DusA [Gammaproteobacteria bacterium]
MQEAAAQVVSREQGAAFGAASPMRLAVAPMMERTDRHCRAFLRLLAPHTRLYTEMVTAAALIHGDCSRLLAFSPFEHPVALQLGGSDPALLAVAARLGAQAGYDEINLNVGCPSDRVQAGCFGAALMREPNRVAACVRAMRAAVGVPVTIKTRLGVDHDDSYAFLTDFVGRVAEAGCETVIVHARKAWLKGLSPKQNREVPPLDYARVHRLKRDFPALEIVLNGGLTDLPAALAELEHVDGIMLGRAAYSDPYLLARLDHAIFGPPAYLADRRDFASYSPPARLEAVLAFLPYLEREIARGTPLKSMTRHLLGLFAGQPGGRRWRRTLGELSSAPEHAAAGISELKAVAERLGR